MKSGEVRNLLSSISKLLEVNAIYFVTGRILESSIPKVMKAYSWDIP
jgi:hypothetical protein